MAAGLDIALDRAVSRITLTGTGVRVETTRGEAQADAVIVTLPLGVLQAGSVRFEPGLPEDKQGAIARLGMGLLDKLYLAYEAPFWDDDAWIVTAQTGLAQGWFSQWFNIHKLLGVPVLLGFNGGPPAFDLAGNSDAEMVEMGASVLARAYPG